MSVIDDQEITAPNPFPWIKTTTHNSLVLTFTSGIKGRANCGKVR